MNAYLDYEKFAKCKKYIELDSTVYILTTKYCDSEINFGNNKKIKTLFIASAPGEIANKQLFNEVLRISESVVLYSYYGCSFEGCNLPKYMKVSLNDKYTEYYNALPRDIKYMLYCPKGNCAAIAPFMNGFDVCGIDIRSIRQSHIDIFGDAKRVIHASFDNESIGLDYKNIIFSGIYMFDDPKFDYTLLKCVMNNMSALSFMIAAISDENVLSFANFINFIESHGYSVSADLVLDKESESLANLLFCQLYDCRSRIKSNSSLINKKFKYEKHYPDAE